MATLKKNTFSKQERLKSRKTLQTLFAKGRRLQVNNVKLIYLVNPNQTGEVKCGVGLNGRFFKKAVDRNRIKRLLKEAYRLQQHELKEFSRETKTEIALFILYTGNALPLYADIYEAAGNLLRQLVKKLHATG